MAAVGAALAALLLLSGWGAAANGITSHIDPSAGSPKTPTSTPADDPTTEAPFGDLATVAKAEPGADAHLSVTNVRAAPHDGYDRVVLDLGGAGTPGWQVEYVDSAVDDASGMPVDVTGGAVLRVVVTGTGLPADTGYDEYSGGPADVGEPAVQQVVYRSVFEGHTTVFVGVDQRRPFRVFALTAPERVAVDVQR